MKKEKDLYKIIFSFSLFFLLILPSSLAFTHTSVSTMILPRSSLSTTPYEYYTYDTMTALLLNLSQAYPEIMTLTSIGTTYEGREIWMVKLSDNVTTEEDEPGVLLMGAHHGNEKPSFEVLIYFIKYIVETYQMENTDTDKDGTINEDPIDGIDNDNDGVTDEDPVEERVRDVLGNTEIYIIPMVNPDGVEYGWRKNREPNYGADGKSTSITSYGVDLNRNYGYMWNIVYLFPKNYFLEYLLDDESWNYRGEKPCKGLCRNT